MEKPNEQQIALVRERFLDELIVNGLGASPSQLYNAGASDALAWVLSLRDEPEPRVDPE